MIEVLNNCTGCGICVYHCPFEAIKIVNKLAQIGEACTLCGACMKACSLEAIRIERKTVAPSDLSCYKGVWVLVEHHNGRIRNVTIELLGEGRKLADKLGEELAAVFLGNKVSDLSKVLAAYGADSIYVVENAALERYNAEVYTDVLTGVICKYKPSIMLFGATINGRELAPCVAARLRVGVTADCTGLDINEQGQLVQIRPAFGGSVMASIVSRTRPQMATVRPNVMRMSKPDWSREAKIHQVEVRIDPKSVRSRVLRVVREVTDTAVNIEEADIIVSGGRGLGSPDNLSLIKELAEVLSATIGGSRAIVDAGWLPHHQQVGQTGRTVSPRLYIAIGISGAMQHIVGMETSDIVVAINKDPEAPIFKVATIGVIGDLFKIVPALVRELRARAKLAPTSS